MVSRKKSRSSAKSVHNFEHCVYRIVLFVGCIKSLVDLVSVKGKVEKSASASASSSDCYTSKKELTRDQHVDLHHAALEQLG